MLKFDWRNGFTIGLILGIMVTLVVLLVLYPPQNVVECHTESVNCRSANGETDNPEPDQEQDALQYWARRIVSFEDTFAQWLMTIISVVAAALLLVTFRETRRIGQAQTRAYLAVTHIPKFANIEADKSHIMGAVIVNTGQTPAYDVGVEASLFVAKTDFQPPEDFWRNHDFGPNGQRGSIAGHTTIFAATHIKYRDAFGKIHESNVISLLAFWPHGELDDFQNPKRTATMVPLPRANIHT